MSRKIPDTDKNTDKQIYDSCERSIRIVETVEKQLEHQKGEAVFCLMFFLCAVSIWILLVALWETLGRPIPPKMLTVGVEIIALFMLLCVVKFTRINIRQMGITGKNLKPALLRGSVVSLIIFTVMMAIKLITKPGQPLFNFARVDPFYAITAILQEFLARGFLLNTLMMMNTSKNSRHIAVICSSLLFTSLHLYYGFTFMIGAGAMSVILGYCYLKDNTIWGVSLIHFVLGFFGFMLDIV